MKTRAVVPIALALAAAVACLDSPSSQCACTEEFRVFTLAVLDDASQPVNDGDLTVTNLRTGRTLESGWTGLLAPGHYAVVDDAMVHEFSPAGDQVRVEGRTRAGSFTADFVFAPDACGCHMQRIAGPDTVVVGEPPPR